MQGGQECCQVSRSVYKYTSVLGQESKETKGVELLAGAELPKGRLEIQKREERYEVGY